MDVYVTGVGIVSGLGLGVQENLQAIRSGRHGMASAVQFATGLAVPVSEVKLSNEALKQQLGLPVGKTFSRTALLGMLAAKAALADSAVDVKRLRVGLISSTSVGGMDLSENFYEVFRKDSSAGRLRQVASHDCGDSTERIAEYLDVNGFVTTISTACSSAGNAIMLGARMVKHGLLDAVVVGGTDALCRFTLNGFNSLMILDKEHCRPFDSTRAGLNLGEGAGYLVLQSEQSLARNPYCTLSGYANVNDAYHQTASSPDGDGPYLSMKKALETAKLNTSDVSYINVHGTGTPNNDLSESRAIIRLFGSSVPPFSSVKAFMGHTLGASEGIEAALSVLSVSNGLVYPNLNFSQPIEETGLLPVSHWQEGEAIRNVLSSSFGFGGSCSSLVFSSIVA